MADPIIKIGSTGEAVRKAQHALYCRRYLVDLSEVDGVFGPVTRNRVIRYQLDRSVGEFFAFSFPLAVDGIVGPMTWSRLTPPLIKKGSKGNPVFLVQEILKSWGYPDYDPGPLDGDFGKLTETAVKNVQAILTDCDNVPLGVDGVVGPKTWEALYA